MRYYILLISFLIFTSCASIELFNKDSEIINTTTGQELIDLKNALDSGAITKEEYNKLKSNIINRESE